MQCFPLYSILLALDNPTVDLLSLDIEGAELQGLNIVVVVAVEDVILVVVVAVMVVAIGFDVNDFVIPFVDGC